MLRNVLRSLAKETKRLHSTARFSLGAKVRQDVTQHSAPDDVVAANRKARLELAVAYRAFERYGLNEGVCNHLTLMTPAADGHGEIMLLRPFGLHWSQVTASSLLGLNDRNDIVEGEGDAELSASNIHRGIHNIRPDATCVMHLHAPYTTALACLKDPRLQMIHQTSLRFYKGVGYDTGYPGYPEQDAVEEGERLGKCMLENDVLIMGNHGFATTGNTVAEAFDKAYYVERTVQLQMIAMATGKPLAIIDTKICEKTYKESRQLLKYYADHHFYGVMRKILRETPDVAD